MILITGISILIVFLTGLLVLPARLILDNLRRKYWIEIPIYFRLQLVPDSQLFFLKIRIFFMPIIIRPFRNRKVNDKNPEIKNAKGNNKNTVRILGLIPQFMSAFKVKKAIADIDTGDFPLNAQLIPLTLLLNNRNIHLQVNFENRNNIDVEIMTKLYKLIWIGIKNKFINSKK